MRAHHRHPSTALSKPVRDSLLTLPTASPLDGDSHSVDHITAVLTTVGDQGPTVVAEGADVEVPVAASEDGLWVVSST